MSGPLYLAWRYLRHHWGKTAILVGSIALIVFLPAGLRVLVGQSAEALTARADATPLLVGARGKDHAALVPHARLTDLVERVKKSTALAIIKQVQSEVDAKMALATGQAEHKLAQTLDEAEARMRRELGAERERLQALREHNPSIRQEELDHLDYRIEECAVHIRHANLQLQALRLIITT